MYLDVETRGTVCRSVSHWPGTPNYARLAGWRVPEICLCLPELALQGCTTMASFTWFWELD